MILLSNVGNRNLLFDGITYEQANWPWKSGNFRDDTRFLLQDPEDKNNHALKTEFEGRVHINILNAFLHFFKEKEALPSSIHLVYSDQKNEDPEIQRQDTLYAARILKQLIETEWQINVVLHAASLSIADQQGWLKYYRSLYSTLRNSHPEQSIGLCDSGGAPQQKHAMKVMAEFMLPPEMYDVYYANKHKGVSKESIEGYRMLLSQEQAMRLAEIGAYDAALALFSLSESDINTPRKNYMRILRLGDLIMIGDWTATRKIIQSTNKRILGDYPFLEALAQAHPVLEQPAGGNIDGDKWILIGIRFMQMRFFARRKRWNQAIMAAQIFFELLLEGVFEANVLKPMNLPLLDASLQRKWILEQAENALESNNTFTAIRNELFLKTNATNPGIKSIAEYRLSQYGTPFMIAAVTAVGAEPFDALTRDFASHMSNNHLSNPALPTQSLKYLNDVRNRIAHDGIMVGDLHHPTIQLGYLPLLIERAGEHLQCSVENTFDQLNQALRDLILKDC